MFNKLATAAVFALAVVLPGGNVFATSTDPDPLCEDSGLWGPKLFTDICWACLFPIKVAGAQLTPGKAPEDAATQHLCLCSKGSSGIYTPGLVVSMWEPARIIEHVKTPGCSPSLGGARLPLGNKRLRSEEHTSELQSRPHLVCRLLLEKKKRRAANRT